MPSYHDLVQSSLLGYTYRLSNGTLAELRPQVVKN